MNDLGRFHSRYRVDPSGCWLWLGCTDKNGYGLIRFGGRQRRAHRIAWTLENGEIPEGMHALHRCDVPGCVNPAHLFLGDEAENQADKVRKGRQAKRESHGRAKLTEEQVKVIRECDKTNAVLAKEFGVSWATIWWVRKGVTWPSS